MSNLGREMRELARQIEDLARASPCYSAAWSIVSNCADHLTAVAAYHELIQEKARANQVR